jgi:hypothetical protein
MEVKQINVSDPIKVEYCIPDWLRDEQIKVNTAKVKGRVQPGHEFNNDPIAVVNFGGSLNDTYKEILNFKHVITCSGAIKFLWEKGFRPEQFKNWYHLDVDPREHKIKLLGKPHRGVQYLPASACHPKYFDYLKGYDVKMWHIFANTDIALRILPQGEWALTGGSSVGLRTITMARFLGYRNQHIFGMDGCYHDKYGSHAAEHPNTPPKHVTTELNGKTYRTTPSMLAVAKETAHELDELPDINVKFYGEGIVQELMKGYGRKPAKSSLIALTRPVLITDEYKAMMKKYHEDVLYYGVGAGNYADLIKKLKESIKADSVLDYGCGKGYLAKSLDFPIWEYDPCVPGKDESPRSADLVVCLDVLEHIEPECLSAVLADIARCTLKNAYFVIHTTAAKKTLPDGRNTHLIQKGSEWWRETLKEFFFMSGNSIKIVGDHLHIVVGPKGKDVNKYTKIKGI